MNWRWSSPPTLFTDFNTKTKDGLLKAMPDGVPIELETGTQVRLEDEDGNSCLAVVHVAAGRGYVVIPIWSTWVSMKVDGVPEATRTTTREAIPA